MFLVQSKINHLGIKRIKKSPLMFLNFLMVQTSIKSIVFYYLGIKKIKKNMI